LDAQASGVVALVRRPSRPDVRCAAGRVLASSSDVEEPGRLYPVVGQLGGVPLCATDGEAGTVRTFLIDPETWAATAVVVQTGVWPGRRIVALDVAHLGRFDWAWTAGALRVDLTRAEIDAAPAFEEGRLRTDDVAACSVAGIDGDVGHVKDLLIDDVSWAVRFVQVEMPGRVVLVPTTWIERLDPNGWVLRLSVVRDQVFASPAWDGQTSPGMNVAERRYTGERP
jgi:hypothetical protein